MRLTVGAMIACTALQTIEAQEPPRVPSQNTAPVKTQLPVRRFDIAAGPLPDALDAFARTAGITLAHARGATTESCGTDTLVCAHFVAGRTDKSVCATSHRVVALGV